MSSGSAVLGASNSNNASLGPHNNNNFVANNNANVQNNNAINNNINAAKAIMKSRGGKIVLPMMVTPPKVVGPSAAEKKLEALTKQLEEEMEKEAAGGSAVMGKGAYIAPSSFVMLLAYWLRRS